LGAGILAGKRKSFTTKSTKKNEERQKQKARGDGVGK
jgi:hypothetical protein